MRLMSRGKAIRRAKTVGLEPQRCGQHGELLGDEGTQCSERGLGVEPGTHRPYRQLVGPLEAELDVVPGRVSSRLVACRDVNTKVLGRAGVDAKVDLSHAAVIGARVGGLEFLEAAFDAAPNAGVLVPDAPDHVCGGSWIVICRR